MRNQTERKSQIARARTLREGRFIFHSKIVKSFTALPSVAEHVAEFVL
jgi:hypothetical protein